MIKLKINNLLKVISQKLKVDKGQSLIEMLLAISVAVIIIAAGSQIVYVSLESNRISAHQTVRANLAQEAIEALETIKNANWHNIYSLTKNTQEYYPKVVSGEWTLSANTDDKTITINGVNYNRWIILSNANRDANGNISASGSDDPSTQKATVVVSVTTLPDLVITIYLTRWANNTAAQTNWSGGAGQESPLISFGSQYFSDDANVDTTTTPGLIKLKPQ